jgi:2-haloacid dehalogenase
MYKTLLYSLLLLCAPLAALRAGAASDAATPIKAVAFDYFVLFDANSVIPAVEEAYPGKGAEFTAMWRAKLFDYGYLRSITHRQTDFFAVTDDALVYTAAAMRLDLPRPVHDRLLQAYLSLRPWPDAAAGLKKLREAGIRIITVSNFSPRMLRENAAAAGLTPFFDELLSTQANGSYKPEGRAYELGLTHLHLKKEEVVFAAFSGWDAYGAKAFGYPTYWVNRFNLPPEQLDLQPDGTSNSMEGLVTFVLARR